ncbi:MAG: hypothetical protein WDZ45_03580, partial [Flavobacteriaceae bacterium]
MRNFYNKLSLNNKSLQFLLLISFVLGNSILTFGQVRVDFEPRTTPAVFNVKGDFAMIGNTNLTLVDYGDNTGNNNDMEYVDVDTNNNTFNSSSAYLDFSTENGASPECSEIVYAGLYWTGRAHNGSDSPNTFEVTKDGITKTLDKRKVLLKGPTSGSYTQFTANQNDIYYPTTSDGFMYSAYTDVTTYVQNNGIGEYFVADIALREGNGGGTGFYGGWGLVVVYENDLMNWRDVTVFDGHSYVAGSVTADFEIPVSGFNTALAGPINMKLGLMAGEGDRTIAGDFFQIRNANNTSWETLNHGGNSTNNFFNSSIYTGGNTRNPNLLNNTGMDVSMFDIDNPGNTIVGNNQTSTRFRYGTTQDTYVIFNITMSVDAYVPETQAVISTTNINGVPASLPLQVEPGQEMEFEVDVYNLGTEPINNSQIKVPIPFASSYVTGSASSSVFFSPPPSPNAISFNPNEGPNGTLTWDIGTLPLPASTDVILGKLTFKLKATEDCLLLQLVGCVGNIPVNGTISGQGAITGVPVNGQEFIQGYEQGACQGQPISAPVLIEVNDTDYVANNCGSTPIVTAFTLCSTDTSVPVSEVSDSFPDGSVFFDQFPGGTPITAFPVNQNVTTYYALPPGAPNSCVFEFTVEILTPPDAPVSIGDITQCELDPIQTLDANDAITSAGTIVWYDEETDGSIVNPILNSVGTVTYWAEAVNEATDCKSASRTAVTLTLNQPPLVDDPADVTACDSYTLPTLTNGNYFTGSGGTGTQLNAGDQITSTATIYVYAATGTTPNCTAENSFLVTINTTPAKPTADVLQPTCAVPTGTITVTSPLG